jgi:hypothetical protein
MLHLQLNLFEAIAWTSISKNWTKGHTVREIETEQNLGFVQLLLVVSV